VVVTINTPMPGTEQYRRAHEYGELDESSWQRFNYWDPVFVPRGLTREVLRAWHREFLRRFYLRPRTLRTHLRAGLGGPSGWRQLARIVGALPGTLCRAKR
jgi:hypothetical protein